MQYFVPSIALLVSALSLYFSVKNWKEANRPIVFVRLFSANTGNLAAALSLEVKNSGNRPALNIELKLTDQQLNNAFAENADKIIKDAVMQCFEDRGKIDILGNGESICNSFGLLTAGEKNTWNLGSSFDVMISYQDLNRRKYQSVVPLRIINPSGGFAGGEWN